MGGSTPRERGFGGILPMNCGGGVDFAGQAWYNGVSFFTGGL